MPPLSRLILVDDDPKTLGTLAYGFERESLEIARAASSIEVAPLLAQGKGEAIVISLGQGAGAELTRELRGHDKSSPSASALPIIVIGGESERDGALAAGASEFLARPTYVRDVTTVVRLHGLARAGAARAISAGELSDFAGVFFLVRALAASRRTGVLTLVRGFRRGELRLYEGEVTSAQLGGLHGLAAFHQLLLWPEARFELRQEDVVRRQQIPLTPAQLVEDASRFLRDFDDMSRGLDPGIVFAQDLVRVAECVGRIPREVTPLLKLFDGSRALADVVEDSPFRIAETVAAASQLVEMGALKAQAGLRPRPGARAALGVDDWLVGVGAAADGAPATSAQGASVSQKVPVPASDWGKAPKPRPGAELPTFAAVVPAQEATGEIKLAGIGSRVVGEIVIAPVGLVATTIAQATEGTAQATSSTPSPVAHGSTPVVEGLLSGSARETLTTTLEQGRPGDIQADGPLAARSGEIGGVAQAAQKALFDDVEEAFFQQEDAFVGAKPAAVESFADLDDSNARRGAPAGFWKRLLGGAPRQVPSRHETRAASSGPTTPEKAPPAKTGGSPGTNSKKSKKKR